MDKVLIMVLAIIGLIVAAAGISLLMAFPISWCWNYAIVSTFGLPAISWGKAWCLSFLAQIFFKSNVSTSKSS